ncbi:penicillin-binding transpeptidase domain-containing protein [Peterkaempfera bronchialis]|uniref:penicillin-binding transpeptidase domain-containing protein n=1 Tax=Peterkaempfera bronchialis TaxID=2126346 RepID=UPI001E5024DF|nr:penicillin-binding transpeptidase domain-containing protein [Peterkaempfera bronchialis]
MSRPGISTTGRRAGTFCLLLIVALLVQATRVQVVRAPEYDSSPANRRQMIIRYAQPRGSILVDGHRITGSEASHGMLRYRRTYPEGPLYAAVTGYSSQIYGNSLLEGVEDGVLSGTDPRLAGFPLWSAVTRKPQPGGDVVTTIDAAAQRAAFQAMDGKRGAVAAVEPATGRILALVSTPSYDPGSFAGSSGADRRAWQALQTDPLQPMLDRALRQTYPPGSTFKVVTAAAGLSAGVYPDPDVRTDSPEPLPLPNSDRVLTNEAPGCLDATLRLALARSCNTVYAKLGVDVGLPGMVRAAEGFGFNDGGLRVPVGVAKSVFDTRMDRAQLALSSIGQYDTRATPLQMAMVAAGVANGGKVMRPRLVDRLTRADGTAVALMSEQVYRQAVAPGVAAELRSMMEDVVTEGTGANARIPGAVVGGKTGTAQNGVGNSGTPYAWFIGYAGPDGAAPKVAVAVVIEDSAARRADISGGGLAAPVARAVMAAVLGMV